MVITGLNAGEPWGGVRHIHMEIPNIYDDLCSLLDRVEEVKYSKISMRIYS